MFSRESELVKLLVERLPDVLRAPGGVLAAREVPTGTRVVDVVAVFGGDDPYVLLDEWGRPIRAIGRLGKGHLSVLALIWAEGRISPCRLSQLTWTPQSDLLACYVKDLARLGLVRTNRYGTLSPTEWATWQPGAIVAIEAKLAAWAECVEQARTNQMWSDYSYVAFPRGGVLRAPSSRSTLRDVGLGGIEVGGDGEVRVVVKPSRGGTARDRAFFGLGMLVDLVHGNRWSLCA